MNASMNSLGHPELLVLESSRYPYFYIEYSLITVKLFSHGLDVNYDSL